jgi:transposase InsO family protein
VWYTDFTEIWYAGGKKKAYFMPILDQKTKWITGWAASERWNTALALEAFKVARSNSGKVRISSLP